MKKYKIELTTTELQKLNIFFVMYEDKLKDESEAYMKLCTDYENFSTKQLDTFKSNSIWFKETYEIIHKIRENLDLIPF